IARLAGDPALEDIMYGAAVDVLAHLATTACPPGVPAYDAATYVAEARLLTQWYIPGAAGAPTPGSNDTTYEALIADTCGPADQGTLVLRDYHSENLIWLPKRKGPARVGLLDYQDARNGHAAYDLVSLLEDARRDTTEDLRARMMARFLDATGMEATEFKALYAALGAQRNLKIMGIFARLALRDQKHAYLSYIPRVWAHVTRDLAHPTLAALSNWVSTHVPPPTSETLVSIAARAGSGGD
ncbi:MAG: phosphotransferase, partial [Pseudomonadota bacterium]